MNIIPRKEEYAPIVTLLESGEYDTPEALAKAIIKQAYATFLTRDWYITLVNMGKASHGYGLSATERAAERLELGGGFPRTVLKIRSAEGHVSAVEERGW